MKGFYWYLLRTLRSFRKAKLAYHNFNVISHMVKGMEKTPYEAFYTFVETHKGVLKILNANFDLFEVEEEDDGDITFANWLRIDTFDKVLKVERSYYIDLETQKIERVELI